MRNCRAVGKAECSIYLWHGIAVLTLLHMYNIDTASSTPKDMPISIVLLGLSHVCEFANPVRCITISFS
jgi:hypothetical protein